MDAWETLLVNSTLSSGDAWEQLNAQEGGGTSTYTILSDGLDVNMATNDSTVELDSTSFNVDVDVSDIIIDVDQSPIEVEY